MTKLTRAFANMPTYLQFHIKVIFLYHSTQQNLCSLDSFVAIPDIQMFSNWPKIFLLRCGMFSEDSHVILLREGASDFSIHV